MKIVTAIYNNLFDTVYGGRLNRERHYLYSLRCLANIGVDIVCYTSKKDLDDIQKYLDDKNITNVTLKIFELNEYQHHNKIMDIKKLNHDRYALDNVWVTRCVEIMWLKLQWLYDESKNSNDKVFWFDAGISHGGIFPKKMNTNYDESDYESTFQNDKAFNINLLDKIDKRSMNKMFAFYCTNRQHAYPAIMLNDERLHGSIVAGIFGGDSRIIKEVYDNFMEIVEFLLNNNELMQEEMILTLIYQAEPELFDVESFDTWYHEDWNCYNTDLISFSKFFEGFV